MKIIQIVSNESGYVCHGLGDDGLVYNWVSELIDSGSGPLHLVHSWQPAAMRQDPGTPKRRTKKQLGRRVARLAGELAFVDGFDRPSISINCYANGPRAIRELIDCAKSEKSRNQKRCTRLVRKLESALKEWEAAQ